MISIAEHTCYAIMKPVKNNSTGDVTTDGVE
jgi:hypothetical protein